MTYLGVAFEVRGKSKATGRTSIIKKKFMDVCFAGLNLHNEVHNYIPESITYYPIPNRQVIKTPREIQSYLNVLNQIFTKSGVELTMEKYFKGVKVSAELPYAYILAYFSAIRMLDENPFAAKSIIQLATYNFADDPHAQFLIGSTITDGGTITPDLIYGHDFPSWRYWPKDVLINFKRAEDALLQEPSYKTNPHKTCEVESRMFGPRDYWVASEYRKFIDGMPADSFRDTARRIKAWLG